MIAYRTFGIFLLNERAQLLDLKLAIRYGNRAGSPQLKVGEGIVGYAAEHKTVVNVPDVTKDTRYIPWVEDCRSELAIPLLIKDRCIGVLDLDSPNYDAFSKHDVELLTLLASQVAVAIENARLYEALRSNEDRLERELSFAQRVQIALLPTGLPEADQGRGRRCAIRPGARAGGDLHDFLSPEASSLVVAVGDVSGKGVPAALYSVFAGELVRSRTFRRRYQPERFSPPGVLSGDEHDPGRATARVVLLHALLRILRLQAPRAHVGELRVTVSAEEHRRTAAPIELPGHSLGTVLRA